jgi:hypothetical protein
VRHRQEPILVRKIMMEEKNQKMRRKYGRGE